MSQAENHTTKEAYKFKAMPSPKEHWLKGSLGLFHQDRIHNYFNLLRDQLGPIYKIHILNKPIVVVSGKEASHYILKSRPSKFYRVFRADTVGVHGILSAEHEEWHRYRKLLNPSLRPSQLKTFYPALQMITERLCKSMSTQKNPFDFQQLIQRYTIDVTTLLVFGYDINTLENEGSELQDAISFIFEILHVRTKSPFRYWNYIKLKRDKKFDECIALVRKEASQFIKTAKAKVSQSSEPQNILESMILEQDESGNTFTEEEIFGNVMTLLVAGEDTSANTVAWAIHYLTENESLQDELRQHVVDNYPSSGVLSWEDLDSFPLISGALQESLRLKPVAPFVAHRGYDDEILEGYNVPAGTMICVLLSPSSMDTTLFDKPEEFNPHRWIDMSGDQRKRCLQEIMPFGAGARACPGMQLSFVEMKLSLIELLYRYKFTKPEKSEPPEEQMRITLAPANLWVNMTPLRPQVRPQEQAQEQAQ